MAENLPPHDAVAFMHDVRLADEEALEHQRFDFARRGVERFRIGRREITRLTDRRRVKDAVRFVRFARLVNIHPTPGLATHRTPPFAIAIVHASSVVMMTGACEPT